MASKSGTPFWLRLLFVIIGILLIVKMIGQDLLPYLGEKCNNVPVTVKEVKYFEKAGNKGASKRKTKWDYSWEFTVDGNKYTGHTSTEKKYYKIGNTTTVFYLKSYPWFNCIDTGAAFGVASLVGVLLGGFFIYLGLPRRKNKQKDDVVISEQNHQRVESKPKQKHIEEKKPERNADSSQHPVAETKIVIEVKAASDEKKTAETKPITVEIPANKETKTQIQQQPKASEALNSEAKLNFCPQCGSKVFAGASFCAGCGKKLI